MRRTRTTSKILRLGGLLGVLVLAAGCGWSIGGRSATTTLAAEPVPAGWQRLTLPSTVGRVALRRGSTDITTAALAEHHLSMLVDRVTVDRTGQACWERQPYQTSCATSPQVPLDGLQLVLKVSVAGGETGLEPCGSCRFDDQAVATLRGGTRSTIASARPVLVQVGGNPGAPWYWQEVAVVCEEAHAAGVPCAGDAIEPLWLVSSWIRESSGDGPADAYRNAKLASHERKSQDLNPDRGAEERARAMWAAANASQLDYLAIAPRDVAESVRQARARTDKPIVLEPAGAGFGVDPEPFRAAVADPSRALADLTIVSPSALT